MKTITITANDGRQFSGTNFYEIEQEVISYEAELKVKEETKKSKDLEKEKAFKEILDEVDVLNSMIKEFWLSTGESIYTYIYNGSLSVRRQRYNIE